MDFLTLYQLHSKMINHGKAVVRSTDRPHIVVDMPFGSYEESPQVAFKSASKIMQETGAQSVKLEGGEEFAETIYFLTQRGTFLLWDT